MNWFTKKHQVTVDGSIHDCCEHLSDGDVAHTVSYENDSWGYEAYAMCEACAQKAQEFADNILEVCHDCGEEKPMKEMIEWKWYDFYAAQGDEPLIICESCKCKDKHKKRVSKDRADYEDEMQYLDDCLNSDDDY